MEQVNGKILWKLFSSSFHLYVPPWNLEDDKIFENFPVNLLKLRQVIHKSSCLWAKTWIFIIVKRINYCRADEEGEIKISFWKLRDEVKGCRLKSFSDCDSIPQHFPQNQLWGVKLLSKQKWQDEQMSSENESVEIDFHETSSITKSSSFNWRHFHRAERDNFVINWKEERTGRAERCFGF